MVYSTVKRDCGTYYYTGCCMYRGSLGLKCSVSGAKKHLKLVHTSLNLTDKVNKSKIKIKMHLLNQLCHFSFFLWCLELFCSVSWLVLRLIGTLFAIEIAITQNSPQHMELVMWCTRQKVFLWVYKWCTIAVVFKPVLQAPLPCTFCMSPLSDTPDSTHQLVNRDCKTWIRCVWQGRHTKCAEQGCL